MSERNFTVIAPHPVDLDDGRLIGPGETCTAPLTDRLKELVDAGLVEAGGTARKRTTDTEEPQP